MQLLRNVNVNWVGHKWLFIGISLVMTIVSLSSLYWKGGPRYGIDFRGGTLVYVKFKSPPNLTVIRTALSQKGLGNSTIQRYDVPEQNQVIISLDQLEDDSEEELDEGRLQILQALKGVFNSNQIQTDRIDLNNVNTTDLTNFLIKVGDLTSLLKSKESPVLISPESLAVAITDYRDSHGGIITSYDDIGTINGVTKSILSILQESSFLGEFSVFQTEFVGPKVGQNLQRQAISATCYALLGVLIYIAIRFKGTIYGAAAVIAVFHDVIITLGLFSFADREISLTVIAALLTLVGYSMNDTIVVFDRIRENLRLSRRMPLSEIINKSINQTLSRTLLTSGSTFLTALSLYFLGGQVINGFAFALVIGVAIGTYSSIGVASPLLLVWYDYQSGKKK